MTDQQWRLLNVGEVIAEGDERYSPTHDAWILLGASVGFENYSGLPIRRRIPAPPPISNPPDCVASRSQEGTLTQAPADEPASPEVEREIDDALGLRLLKVRVPVELATALHTEADRREVPLSVVLRERLAAPAAGQAVVGAVWHRDGVSLIQCGTEDAWCANGRGYRRMYLTTAAPSTLRGELEALLRECPVFWDAELRLILAKHYGDTRP
jgi:hypothetical protein